MSPELKTEIEQTLPLLHGWCQLEKALHLARLIVDNHAIHKVVEIGVFGGQSLIPMAMAIRQCSRSGFAIGIEPWSVAAATEGDVGKENADWWANKVNLEEIYEGFVRAVLDLKLTYRCRWIRMHSEEVAELFSGATIDLLHLDSNHSEMASCRDVETWVPKLAPGGYLVFDDSNWPTQQRAMILLESHLEFQGHYPNGQGNQYSVFRKP